MARALKVPSHAHSVNSNQQEGLFYQVLVYPVKYGTHKTDLYSSSSHSENHVTRQISNLQSTVLTEHN